MHKLPKTVEVGPYLFTVVRPVKKKKEELAAIGGLDFQAQEISVYDHLGADAAVETLLHEVLHACCFLSNSRDEDMEERLVQTISCVLLDTLRRNPELVRALTG